MDENETRDKINEFIKEYDITEDDFDGEQVFSWCRQYDEHIDQTNLAQFIMDRWDKPLLFIERFTRKGKKSRHLSTFESEN